MNLMRLRPVPAACLLAAVVLLGGCSGPLLQPAPPAGSTPPAASGLPPRAGAPAACVREGEPCDAPGTTCCAGFICVGSRGGVCTSQF